MRPCHPESRFIATKDLTPMEARSEKVRFLAELILSVVEGLGGTNVARNDEWDSKGHIGLIFGPMSPFLIKKSLWSSTAPERRQVNVTPKSDSPGGAQAGSPGRSEASPGLTSPPPKIP